MSLYRILNGSLKSALLAFVLMVVTQQAMAATATLELTAPRGGEVFIVGQTQIVRVNTKFKTLTVELSRDGGVTFVTLGTIDNTTSDASKRNVLSFTVTAPEATNCIIRVTGAQKTGNVVVNSGAFVVTAGNSLAPGFVPTLADGSVTNGKLADSAITSTKLADKSVTAAKLNSGAASNGFVLEADGVGGAQYVPLTVSIPSNSVVDASINPSAGIQYSKLNLANSILASDIKTGAIVDSNISGTAGIQYSKLNLANSISGTDIKLGSILDVHINANAGIQYSKLNLFNSILGSDIKAGTLADAQISSAAGIKYAKLNLFNSIQGSDIQAGSINDSNISPSAGIQYSKLNLTNSIGATDIKALSITDAAVSATAGIKYSKLSLANSIAKTDIVPGAIDNSLISAAAGIQYSKLNLANSISGADIAAGAISDAAVSATAGIQYSKLNLANSISGTDIKAGSINDALVSATAGIQYSKLNLANSIVAGDLSAGQIADVHVSATAAIGYSKLNLAGSVKGSDLAAGTVTPDRISTTGALAGQGLVYNGTSLVYGNTGFSLPFVQSQPLATTLLDLTSTSGFSVASFAINNPVGSSAALIGKTNGTGSGVLGQSASGDGVFGQSTTGTAIRGRKLATETGSAGVFENLNATNTSEIVTISNVGSGTTLHASTSGGGTMALLESTNALTTAPVVNVSHAGTGHGVLSTSNGGIGVYGVTHSTDVFGSGVQGDNGFGGAGVTGRAFSANTAGVVGNNGAAGPGVFGYSVADGGFGLYGIGGAGGTGTNSTAAHFENVFNVNAANTVEIVTNSPSPALDVTTSSQSAGVAIQVTTPAATGSTAINVKRGTLALSSDADYVAPATIEHGYLVVQTAGPIALPVATIADGTTVWVVNNSLAAVTVSNVTGTATVTINTGNAKQFLFIKSVSATNWIPVQQ